MNTVSRPPSSETASKRAIRLARSVIPAGVNTNYRKTRNYEPIYPAHAQGAWLTDIDGTEYIDFALGLGSAILGHNHPAVTDAIQTQMARFSAPGSSTLEAKAAARIVKHVPSAQLVRFTCSGNEANLGALRVARAYTGRRGLVRFDGHYHGSSDELLGGVPGQGADMNAVAGEREGDVYSALTNTKGRHPGAFDDVYMIDWNDIDALRRCLDRYGEDIAAVLMEPVMINNSGCLPRPGYLEAVREECSRRGIVLIFDEVLTGFRMGLSGAQGAFGVLPDITILGKAIGNGFPVSAFCGSREVMSPLVNGDAVLGGTYNGHPLAMAAVIAVLDELARDEGRVYRRFAQLAATFTTDLVDLAAQEGHALSLQGFPGAWAFNFTDKPIACHANKSLESFLKEASWNRALLRNGVLANMRLTLSGAHGAAEMEVGLTRMRAALRAMPAQS